ncbi:MAG: ATP-binding protein, partial [Blastocatellia bacterium]
RGVIIRTGGESAIDQVTGDPERLQQVIGNLLSNAVKFSARGGEVRVRLDRVDPYLCVTVSDDGRGIEPGHLPYIFDRFHQADAAAAGRQGGLGLGLALARYLVELHGGMITAVSEGEGRGAAFTVRLPVRAIQTEPEARDEGCPRERKAVAMAGALRGLTALIVDDEPDARDLLKALLGQFGAEIIVAASADEAFSLLAASAPEKLPDVLVSDIGMPEKDGYSLIRRIRELPPEQGGMIPAVALTAFSRATDRVRALSAGFQMHVPKPVEQAELVMVMATLTGRQLPDAAVFSRQESDAGAEENHDE